LIRVFAAFRRHLRPYRRILAVGALLEIVTTGLAVAQPWPLKVIVDDVLKAPGHRASTRLPLLDLFAGSPKILLAGAIITLLLIVGLSALSDYWSTTLMAGTGERLGNDIRESLFAHLQALSLRYHGEHRVGDLASRVSGDVDRIQDMMVQTLAILLPNVLLIVGMVTVMFAVDPVFAALCLVAFPFLALTVYRSTLRLKQATRRARRLGGVVAAAATETLGAIHVVQAFSLEEPSQARFRDLNRASLAATLEAVRQQARLSPAVDVAAAVSTAAVFWFGANRVLSGTLSLGLLLVFMAYVASLYKPVRNLAKLGYITSRGIVSAERVQGILSESPDVCDAPYAAAAPTFRGSVRFDDVSFSYRDEPVLRGIDLRIEPGETVALVGPTGAGKSTLVSLVPRFYDPQQGAVRIDERDVRDYTLASLRGQIGLVLQDTVLFHGTLWDNVACGRPGATWDEVDRAMELAFVDEFASRLPNGVATMLDERGVNLSGGQRQRIAIARAIVRGAPILILDEPTSALDAAAESLVVDALGNLMRDRTTVVIAHRLSTVRRADRVVVLKGGEIVEEGSHATLVRVGGEYAQMAALQSALGPGGNAASGPVPNGSFSHATKSRSLDGAYILPKDHEHVLTGRPDDIAERAGRRATRAVVSTIGRVILTIGGSGLLIAGAMGDWVSGIAGTSIRWDAFYRADPAGGYPFVTSAGAIVILVAIVASLGLAPATGWPTRLSGVLGVTAFVLFLINAIRGDVVTSVDQIQAGMWLILGGGILAVIGGFLGRSRIHPAPQAASA
jgi:ATP-binding cassette subfamily B protein